MNACKSPWLNSTLCSHAVHMNTSLCRAEMVKEKSGIFTSFLNKNFFKLKKIWWKLCLWQDTDVIPSETKLKPYEGDLVMFQNFFSDPNMILTLPQKIFYFKKYTHHTHFWIDVNCVFWKNIDIYSYFDTIDGFGYRGIERRCGKIPHMTYLSYGKVGIWIDSHVGIKWFPPYWNVWN